MINKIISAKCPKPHEIYRADGALEATSCEYATVKVISYQHEHHYDFQEGHSCYCEMPMARQKGECVKCPEEE